MSTGAGGWVNGLLGLRSVESNPLNAKPTDWYNDHRGSLIATSCREHEANRQRKLAIYQQQQRWHAQPWVDMMQWWAPIHAGRADAGVAATEAIRRQGLEQHAPGVVRPNVLYSDPQGEGQSAQAKILSGLVPPRAQ